MSTARFQLGTIEVAGGALLDLDPVHPVWHRAAATFRRAERMGSLLMIRASKAGAGFAALAQLIAGVASGAEEDARRRSAIARVQAAAAYAELGGRMPWSRIELSVALGNVVQTALAGEAHPAVLLAYLESEIGPD